MIEKFIVYEVVNETWDKGYSIYRKFRTYENAERYILERHVSSDPCFIRKAYYDKRCPNYRTALYSLAVSTKEICEENK